MTFRNMILTATGAAMTIIPAVGVAAHPPDYRAQAEILTRPIADVENDYWFDYLTDISEAEHELSKDLARATDNEDREDAVEEYHTEIADANRDYKKEMVEKGYNVGRVTVG